MLTTVRNAIQQNVSRFAQVRDRLADDEDRNASNRAGEARALATLGYAHEIDFKLHYLIHDSGWAEILKGFDLKMAADVLLESGFMLWGDGGRRTRKQRVGSQSPRFYTVSATILEYDETEDAAAAQAVPDDWAPAGWD